MKTARSAAGCMILLIIFSSAASAGDLPKFFLSIRLAENGESNVQGHRGLIFDSRYFLTDRFDLGLSYQLTDPQRIGMPSKIENRLSSGSISSEATRQVCSFYSLYHPFARDRTVDYYLGAGINLQLLHVEDIVDEDYRVTSETPPALGVSAKTGANWFFHENIGLTLDAEVGTLFHDYSAKERHTGLSADFKSPWLVGLLSIGISFRF
ncbi:MAG: hypothetical protein LJE94_00010 [Deltaproteobacteria bacterium]|nr:hypothetical protein [Deltaproteobacteria bacterium]